MKVARAIKLNDQGDFDSQIRSLRSDLDKLYLLSQGRIRFGRGTDGDRGENISGKFQEFTSHATPDTEFSVSHGLDENGQGAVPVGRIVLWQDKAGSLYQGPSDGTAWTTSTAYFKCDVASVTFLVFFLK